MQGVPRHEKAHGLADRRLAAVAWIAVVTMFAVVMAGALVSATGSGEGCGRSWPLCGSSTWDVAAVIEFSHRVVSGLAAVAVLLLVVLVLRRWPDRRDVRWLAGLAVGFLLLQSALGAGVVIWGQPDAVLALHFGISLVSFAAVALLGLRVRWALQGRMPGLPMPDHRVPAALRRATWAGLVLIYGVVYTGALVRHTQSSLACPEWPLCGGPITGAAAIQMLHRLAAALAVVAVVEIARRAAKVRGCRPDLYRGAVAALVLVLVQSLGGGLIVLTRLSLPTTLLHSAVITLLFTLLSHLAMETLGHGWQLAAVTERSASRDAEPVGAGLPYRPSPAAGHSGAGRRG